MNVEPLQPYLEPLRKSVTVPRPVAEAFDLFTARMSTWWPLRTHSVYEDRAVACGIEPRVGGLIYEERDDGERCTWGKVLVWDPPHRVVLFWHPGREADSGQEVEFRFTPDGDGTRLDLEHRDWTKLGDKAPEAKKGYSMGWDIVLGNHFVPACGPDRTA
jgi:uncharacterized protein YndB with AHSA1/START domain